MAVKSLILGVELYQAAMNVNNTKLHIVAKYLLKNVKRAGQRRFVLDIAGVIVDT